MAEPVLDQPRVMAGIGQGVAAGVAQHVGMDPKRQLGALANGLHEAVDGVSRKWTAAFGLEDEGPRRVPLQLAQHAQFIAANGMHRGLAVLGPADVQCRIAAPLDLRPLQIGDLDGPQAVPEGNQDQRSVPLAVAPQLGGCDQLLDLGWGQVFAGTHLGIRPSCRYFPINVVWLDQPQPRHHQHFPLHPDSNLPDKAHSSESRTGCKCRVSQSVSAEVSVAIHHTAPSLVSSVGSVGLGSAWEASRTGSAFGVTPSISSRPPGWTMILRKVICTLPPSESDAASVWGRILARRPAYALEFSTASLVK